MISNFKMTVEGQGQLGQNCRLTRNTTTSYSKVHYAIRLFAYFSVRMQAHMQPNLANWIIREGLLVTCVHYPHGSSEKTK